MSNSSLLEQANKFISQYGKEKGLSKETIVDRQCVIHDEIESTGTYTHTLEEITYGAKLAWRNSA